MFVAQLLLETIKRRKIASVGGITRWKKIGSRPDPRRSRIAKLSAKKGTTKLKRKMAMKRLMRSGKGQRLRAFRSQMSKGRRRTHGAARPRVHRASRPRTHRAARPRVRRSKRRR